MTRRAWFILACMVAASAAARLWFFAHSSLRVFIDTIDYAFQSRHPLLSRALLAGLKPPLTPLLIKAGGMLPAYTVVQVTVAICCWSILTAVIAHTLRAPAWLRIVAAAAVLALSLSQTVAQWDRVVLSESIAFSLLALVVGLGILLASRFAWPRAAAFLLAMGAWAAVRDSDTTVIAALAILLIAGVVLRRLDRRALAIAVGALAIVGLSLWSSSLGNRWFYPTAQVLRVRILATDEGYRWLAQRHPPQLAAVAQARAAGIVVEDQPQFAAWDNWVRSAGQRAVLAWLVEHPRQIFLAPITRPEAAIGAQSTSRYRPFDYNRAFGRLDAVVWWPGSFAPALLGVLIALATFQYRPKQASILWVGLVCAFLALPHAWLAWLLNPMETPRHALMAELQYRLGMLVAGPVALSAYLERRAERRQALPAAGITPPRADTPEAADQPEPAAAR